MEFTQKEFASIARSKTKAKSARFVRIIILIAMLISVGCMYLGAFDTDRLVYFLFAAVYVAIAHPQLSNGPSTKILLLFQRKSQSDKTDKATSGMVRSLPFATISGFQPDNRLCWNERCSSPKS